MLVREYENFDELFFGLNREIITNPWNIIDYSRGIQGYVDNVFLKSKTSDCTLDLSKFGYKLGKWEHLLRTYIDWDELVKFKEKLAHSSSLSLTYYFKQKKVNNGSCLIAIVLTRDNRKSNWNKVNVMHRTTEWQRRFAADLVLVHHFINELPWDICDIKEVTFYMAQSYSSGMFINGYFNIFGVKREDLDYDHPWIKSLDSNYKRFFQDESQLNSYKALQRMQRLYFGLDVFPPIPIDSLSIVGVFSGKGVMSGEDDDCEEDEE